MLAAAALAVLVGFLPAFASSLALGLLSRKEPE
jgi:hypothetical protein